MKHPCSRLDRYVHGIKRSTAMIVIIAIITPSIGHASATTPDVFTYQGKLLTSAGSAITTAHTFRFSFWKSADWTSTDTTGGGAINTGATNYGGWNEVQTVTPNSAGTFSVQLGSSTALPTIDFASHKYVQVEVKTTAGADTTYQIIDPTGDAGADANDRMTLGSLPYAKNAETVANTSIGTASGNLLILGANGKISIAQMAAGTNAQNFAVNAGNAVGDAILTFGNSVLAQSLKFSSSNNRFEFSKDLYITGALGVNGAMSGTSLNVNTTATVGGTTTLNGAVTHNSTTTLNGVTTANANVKVRGNMSGSTLTVDDTATVRSLVSQTTIAATGDITTAANATLNSGNAAQDAVLTFGNSTLAQTLKFSHANQRFEFTKDLYITGTLGVTGTMSGRTLNVSGSGAKFNGQQYYMPRSIVGGTGSVLKAQGNGTLYWGTLSSSAGTGTMIADADNNTKVTTTPNDTITMMVAGKNRLTISGTSLTVSGSTVPVAGASFQSLTRTLASPDTTGTVGQHTSIKIGADNLPVIAYYDVTNNDLKVTKCGNATCTSGNTTTTIDSFGDVGKYPSLAIGSDSFPIIAYYDDSFDRLKFAKCSNAACSASTTLIIDNNTLAGLYPSVAIGTDGFPVISYLDGNNADLKVVKCGSISCGGNTTTTVESTNAVGYYSSIAIGADGFPVIAHYDGSSADVRVLKCGNAACTSGNTASAVDTVGNVGSYLSLAIGTDSYPVISYTDSTNTSLKVAKCGNGACSSGNLLTTVDTGNTGYFGSITIGSDGFPVVAYYDDATDDLKIAKCGNAACTSGNTITSVDTTGDVGAYTSITLAPSGYPVISYHDTTNGDLKVAMCADRMCATTSGGTYTAGNGYDIGSPENYFKNIYTSAIKMKTPNGFLTFTGTDSPRFDMSVVNDGDNDTKIQVEETTDEDILRFDTAGKERLTIGATGMSTFSGSVRINNGNGLNASGSLLTNTNITLNSDNSATNAVLTFGNSTLAQTITFSHANQRFEFSRDLYIIGTLGVSGTMSGRTLNVSGSGTRLRGTNYFWPTSIAGGSGAVLKTQSNGTLYWGTVAAGGGGSTTFQTVTNANASATGWGYTVLVTAGAATRTITLPTAVGATGQFIEVKKVDAGTGTVIIDGFGSEEIDTSSGVTINGMGQSVTLRSNGTTVTATNNFKTDDSNVVASFMSVTTAGSVSISEGNALPFNTTVASYGSDISHNGAGVFTLKAGKTYKLYGTPGNGATSSARLGFIWRDSTAGTDIGTSGNFIAGADAYNAPVGTQPAVAVFTPQVDTQVFLKTTTASYTGGGTLASAVGNVNKPIAIIEVIAGNAPVTGQSVDYVYVKVADGAGFTNNSYLDLTSVSSGNIPVDTAADTITLTAGKTYNMKAMIRCYGGSSTLEYGFVDATTGNELSSLTGRGMCQGNSSLEHPFLQAELNYTPSANQAIKVRGVGGGSGVFSYESRISRVVITQLGSSALTSDTIWSTSGNRLTGTGSLGTTGTGALAFGLKFVTNNKDRLTISTAGVATFSGSLLTRDNFTLNSDNDSNDAVLTFGNSTASQTLKFVHANQRFEFTKDLYITGALGVTGTMSGRTLNVSGSGTRLRGTNYFWPTTIAGGTGSVLKAQANGNLYWGSITGGSTTMQTVTNASASATGWDYTVLVTAGAATRTITLPTAVGNAGRSIEVKKVDSGTGSVVIDGFGTQNIDTASGVTLSARNASVILRSDGSNVKIVGDAQQSYVGASFIEVRRTTSQLATTNDHANFTAIMNQYGNDISLDTTSSYSTTANIAAAGRFTLKAGKTYRLTGNLGDIAYASASNTNLIRYGWYNADTSTVIGEESSQTPTYNGNQHDGSAGEATAVFTPSVDTRVELRITNSQNLSSISDSLYNASARAFIEVIAGNAPVIGQSVDYVQVNRITSNQSVVLNDTVIYNTISAGNIPYNTTTGVFTLTAGKTYNLLASSKIRNDGTGSTGRYVQFEWVDANTNTILPGLKQGVSIMSTSALNESGTDNAGGIYTPGTNQTIKVRITGLDGSNMELDSLRTSAVITQLGSSAITSANRTRSSLGSTISMTTHNTWTDTGIQVIAPVGTNRLEYNMNGSLDNNGAGSMAMYTRLVDVTAGNVALNASQRPVTSIGYTTGFTATESGTAHYEITVSNAVTTTYKVQYIKQTTGGSPNTGQTVSLLSGSYLEVRSDF